METSSTPSASAAAMRRRRRRRRGVRRRGDRVGEYDACGICTDLGRCTSADVSLCHLGPATVKSVCSTCAENVEAQGHWVVWTRTLATSTAGRAVRWKLGYAAPGLDCDGTVLVVEGCTDGLAPNFNPAANLDDGSCLEGGCIVPSACNFNAEADFYVDGACEFDSCVGCMDEAACNFDPEATLGSLAMCTYPLAFYLGCDGACLNDVDGDGICDELEIPGCTSPDAPNFNPYATDDNGTCVPPLVGGCILPFACNYDESATFYVPGSCDFECLYGASGSSPCTAPEACNVGEDGPCEFLSCLVLGCTLASACNFNPDATVHDGSCEFISCGGCMNPLACDFEPTATIHTGCADFVSCVGVRTPTPTTTTPTRPCPGGVGTGCTLPEAATTTPTPTCRMGLVNSTPRWAAWRRAHATTPQEPPCRILRPPLPILIVKETACWRIAARFGSGDAQTDAATTTPPPTWKTGPATTNRATVVCTPRPPTTTRQPLGTTVHAHSCSARNCPVWTPWAQPISTAMARCKFKT